MKKIYIINGVMGVIGSPVFTHLALQSDTIVYGISRRGLHFSEYLDKDNTLPENHIVCSLGDFSESNLDTINTFIKSVPCGYEIIFLHSMGFFLTEMNQFGDIVIENDFDKDGINDDVKRLVYTVPKLFAESLAKKNTQVSFIQIGSLSDEKSLPVHHSWRNSMNLVKEEYQNITKNNSNFSATIINVSSVLTPKEFIDRPFVTTQTDADTRYWLNPSDIARYIYDNRNSFSNKYNEVRLFNPWPNFEKNHFTIESYTKRRRAEIFKID